MGKIGKAKNGNNKAKHSRLMSQKKNKIKSKKELSKLRMAALKNRIKDKNDSVN